MFNSGLGMSPADFAAMTGNNNGMWGGDGAFLWWIIIIIALFNNGWGGWGNNSAGAADNYVLASDFATLQRQIDSATTSTQSLINSGNDQLQRQVTQIGNGISSLGYDQLNQINGVNNNIFASTNSLTAGITNLGSQLQQCCCQNRYDAATQFAQLNYNLADQSCQTRRTVQDSTASIIANQDANTRSILDFLTQDKIATLTSENAALKAAANNASQTYDIVNQLKQPTPIPAYVVSSPYCNCGCNSGCGC